MMRLAARRAAAAFLPLLLLCGWALRPTEARRRTTRQPTGGKPNLYQVLNLTSSATIKQIKSQYKKWSRMLHPDITTWPKEKARKKLIEVTEAYEVLGDEDRRKTYDGTGEIDIGTKPLHHQTGAIFSGEHDAHVFPNGAAVRRMLNRTESWVIFFWQKECHECVAHAETFSKFATRMKGIVHVGTIDCTDMVPECRLFKVDRNKLPQIKMWIGGESVLYQTKYGKIEVQSLVEWAAQSMLTEAAALAKDYRAPPKKGKKPKPGKEPTFPKGPEKDEVWPLITFEYDTCMDCRTELALAVDGTRKYTQVPMRALRVDCTKNAKFCNKHAPKQPGLAWNVGSVTHPKGAGQNAVQVKLMEQRRQFDARDLIGFVLEQQPSAVGTLDGNAFQSLVSGGTASSQGVFASFFGSDEDANAAEDAWAVAFVDQGDESRRAQPYLEMVALEARDWRTEEGHRLHVASIDCAANRAICNRALGARAAQRLPQLRLYPATKAAKSDPLIVPVADPKSMTEKLRTEAEPLEIVRLDPATYQKRFANPNERGNWYVLWNAGDWCPPCIAMREPWRQMARTIKSENKKVKFNIGVVDCDNHKWLCQQNGIDSYPTMRFHPEGGSHSDHAGERTAEKLLAWGRDQIGSKVVKPGQAVFSMTKDRLGEPLVVLFSAGGWCPPCAAIAPRFAKAAKRLAPLTFAHVDCDSEKYICNAFGINSYPFVALYANGPGVGPRCHELPSRPKQRQCRNRNIVVFDEPIKQSTTAMVHTIRQHLPGFEFAPPDPDQEEEEDEEEQGAMRNLKESEYNNDVLLQRSGPQNWFVLWTGGEWCPPCQQMKKTWRDLSWILQTEAPSVKMGVMNCDEHQQLCQMQAMRSLPTAFFYPAGKRAQPYPGMRDAEAMADWVTEQLELSEGGSNVLSPGSGMVQLAKDGKPLLALFSAGEWCPPCMAIYARFAKVSKVVPELRLAQVNCDEEQETCKLFGITSFPTVIFYGRALSTTRSGCVHHIKSDGSRQKDEWDCSAKSWMHVLPQDDKHSATAIISFARKMFAKIKAAAGGGDDGSSEEDEYDNDEL